MINSIHNIPIFHPIHLIILIISIPPIHPISLHTHITTTHNVQKRSDLRHLQHSLPHQRMHDRLHSRGRLHENGEKCQEETEVLDRGRFAQGETKKPDETLEEDEVAAADGGTKKTHQKELDIAERERIAHIREFFQNLRVNDHDGHHLCGRIGVLVESEEPERSKYGDWETGERRSRCNDIIAIARSMRKKPRKQRGEGDALTGRKMVVVEAGGRISFARRDERGSTSRNKPNDYNELSSPVFNEFIQ